MRYILLDKITGLETGRRLTAIKNVTFSDGLAQDLGPNWTPLPATMLMEAMAQAAGVLVAATVKYRAQPVLAKIQGLRVYKRATPGDQIEISADLENLTEDGARASVTAELYGSRLAEAIIFLALISPQDAAAGDASARARSGVEEGFAVIFPDLFERPQNGAERI